MFRITILLFLIHGIFFSVCAQEKYVLSGFVRDISSGEDLIGATIVIEELENTGTISNSYGFYSVSIPKGDYTVRYQFMGYNSKIIKITIDKNVIIDAELAEKSFETKEHAERIVELSHKLGLKLNLSESMLNELRLLATLHDIGKMSIDSKILNKQDRLTEEEWFEMHKHPEIGYRIARSSSNLFSIITRLALLSNANKSNLSFVSLKPSNSF